MSGALSFAFLRDYARRPLNLVLLLVVPVVFVTLSAGVIVKFADILGGLANFGSVEAATAGWAAALLAGIGAFFQVTSSRDADRRLAAAGSGTRAVVSARLLASLSLATVATVGALGALALRAGIHDVPRAVGATFMFALIYLGIGTAVGALARDELNGSLIVLSIWMFDMFLGPGFSASHSLVLRVFPTHFPTLVTLGIASGHSTATEDLTISLAWTVGAVALGAWLLVRSTRPIAPDHRSHIPDGLASAGTALRYAFRQYRRNIVTWVLLAVTPAAFISLSFVITPDQPAPIRLSDAGHIALKVVSMTRVHGAIMVPITIAFLAGVAGLFVVLGSAQADRRLVLAGFRTPEVLAARIGIIWGVALLVTGVSLGVTAINFTPQQWGPFIAANVLIALTYGMIGVIVGMLAGRLGGLYLIVALPFIDVGIAQNVMFDVAPPVWAQYLPAHGATKVLIDAAFTTTFDQTGALVLALVWLGAVTFFAIAIFHRLVRPQNG